MSNPNWLEAPEGATHYYTQGDINWRDLSGEHWRWFSNGKWHCDNEVCFAVDTTSKGLLERKRQFLIPRPSADEIRTLERLVAEQYQRDAECLTGIINSMDGADNLSIAKLILDCGYRRLNLRVAGNSDSD